MREPCLFMFLRAHTDSEMGVHYDVTVGVYYGTTSLFLEQKRKEKLSYHNVLPFPSQYVRVGT